MGAVCLTQTDLSAARPDIQKETLSGSLLFLIPICLWFMALPHRIIRFFFGSPRNCRGNNRKTWFRAKRYFAGKILKIIVLPRYKRTCVQQPPISSGFLLVVCFYLFLIK